MRQDTQDMASTWDVVHTAEPWRADGDSYHVGLKTHVLRRGPSRPRRVMATNSHQNGLSDAYVTL